MGQSRQEHAWLISPQKSKVEYEIKYIIILLITFFFILIEFKIILIKKTLFIYVLYFANNGAWFCTSEEFLHWNVKMKNNLFKKAHYHNEKQH